MQPLLTVLLFNILFWRLLLISLPLFLGHFLTMLLLLVRSICEPLHSVHLTGLLKLPLPERFLKGQRCPSLQVLGRVKPVCRPLPVKLKDLDSQVGDVPAAPFDRLLVVSLVRDGVHRESVHEACKVPAHLLLGDKKRRPELVEQVGALVQATHVFDRQAVLFPDKLFEARLFGTLRGLSLWRMLEGRSISMGCEVEVRHRGNIAVRVQVLFLPGLEASLFSSLGAEDPLPDICLLLLLHLLFQSPQAELLGRARRFGERSQPLLDLGGQRVLVGHWSFGGLLLLGLDGRKPRDLEILLPLLGVLVLHLLLVSSRVLLFSRRPLFLPERPEDFQEAVASFPQRVYH